MARDFDESIAVTKTRHRTLAFSAEQPFGQALPKIVVNREFVPLDADGNRVGASKYQVIPLDTAKIIARNYTAAGATLSGAQIMALVTEVLDVESIEYINAQTQPEQG